MVTLTGELRDVLCIDAHGVGLGATLKRCQRRQVGSLALVPPGAQGGGLHTLATHQRADLSGFAAQVGCTQDAPLVGVGEGAPTRTGNDFWGNVGSLHRHLCLTVDLHTHLVTH